MTDHREQSSRSGCRGKGFSWQGQIHHHQPEVVVGAEPVEGGLVAVDGGVAEDHADGLLQQLHRSVGVGMGVRNRDARAVAPREACQSGVATGGLAPLLSRPRRQVTVGSGRFSGRLIRHVAGCIWALNTQETVAAVLVLEHIG
jgi:hypothetical protein